MKTIKELTKQQGIAVLERPRFSPGLLLEDDDLTAGVDYTRGLMRLMFSSLFGCGVICGLDFTAELTCNSRKLEVTVKRGLALDCAGNPIQVPKPVTLTYDPDCKPMPRKIWVVVCYLEKCCRPRDVSCSSDDDSSMVQTRAMDGFEIKLYDQPPECACSCEDKTDKATPKTADKCCQDDTSVNDGLFVNAEGKPADATAAAATAAVSEDETRPGDEWAAVRKLCKCYADHADGECACECGCNCVMIGTIDTTNVTYAANAETTPPKPATVSTNRDTVRWIRPVLIGLFKCMAHAQRERPHTVDAR